MIIKDFFDAIVVRAKGCRYSSMNYLEYDDCKNAVVVRDDADLILLRELDDGSVPVSAPAMLHFAANDFARLIDAIAEMSGDLRLHFVPREHAAGLAAMGFIEWGEFTDFFNTDLAATAARLVSTTAPTAEYLVVEDSAEAAALSQRCRLQSRGFEGETAEWFADWLKDNKVIIVRQDGVIAGFCCITIYDSGKTLWIREMAVDPLYQGRGLGKLMLEQAIMYGVQNGAVKGFLAADLLNHNAIGLYNKYDFIARNTADSELQMIRGGTA